jgi:hypothetical protein
MKHLVVVFLAVVATVGVAETVNMQPGPDECIDTFVWEKNPDINYEGYYNSLFTGYDAGYVWPLIRFSGLDDPQFEGCTVVSSTLILTPNQGQTWGVLPITYTFYLITADWDPETVTWNNKPPFDTSLSIEKTCYNDNGEQYFDFTPFVVEWLENDYPKHGFIFGPQSSDDYHGMSFYSGEYGASPEYRPFLQVVYIPGADVKTASWGVIKTMQ